eukprot:Pgem_evm1s1508
MILMVLKTMENDDEGKPSESNKRKGIEVFTPSFNEKNNHKKSKSGFSPNYHINQLSEEKAIDVIDNTNENNNIENYININNVNNINNNNNNIEAIDSTIDDDKNNNENNNNNAVNKITKDDNKINIAEDAEKNICNNELEKEKEKEKENGKKLGPRTTRSKTKKL